MNFEEGEGLGQTIKSSLIKNSITLSLAEVTAMLISALTGFMIPRLLTVVDFGRFAVATSFAQILSIVVDSGMGQHAAKSIAKDAPAGLKELNQIFSWRILVIVIFSLISPLLVRYFFPSLEIRTIAIWLVPALLLINMTDFYSWVFKGAERFGWCALLLISSRAILFVLCLLALLNPQQIPFLLLAHAVTGVSATLFGFFILGRYLHVIRPMKLDQTFFVQSLPNIYKLGFILILGVVLSRADVLLVERICGVTQTGLYGSSVRLIDGLRVISLVAYGICLPRLSAVHKQMGVFRHTFRWAFTVLLILSTLFAIAGSLFAEPLFVFVLGSSYQPSAIYFKPLVWGCILNFSNVLLLAGLYSLNDHRMALLGVAGALIVDIGLNLILLPHFGAVGASWSRVIADVVGFGIQAYAFFKHRVFSGYEVIGRPCLMVGTALVIFLFMQGQPALFRWAATSGAFLIVTLFLNSDLIRREKAIGHV